MRRKWLLWLRIRLFLIDMDLIAEFSLRILLPHNANNLLPIIAKCLIITHLKETSYLAMLKSWLPRIANMNVTYRYKKVVTWHL